MTAPTNGPVKDRRVEARARVVAVAPGLVTLETRRLDACASCGVARSCGTAALYQFLGVSDERLQLASADDFAIGQSVVLTVPETGLLLAAALAYLTPLAGLLASTLLATALGASEIAAICTAATGLAAGLFAARTLARWPGFVARLLPIRLEPRAPNRSCAPQ
jgi:positive regulator of sigma E activity